jgi:hypothetical protein
MPANDPSTSLFQDAEEATTLHFLAKNMVFE